MFLPAIPSLSRFYTRLFFKLLIVLQIASSPISEKERTVGNIASNTLIRQSR